MKPLPLTRMASSHNGQSVGVEATAAAAYARDTPESAAVMRHASDAAAAAALPKGTPTATAGESSAGLLLAGSHGAATAASAATPENDAAGTVADAGGSALVAT